MDIKEFIAEKHPDLIDEFHRYTTPNYYETGVLYYPITNGFGTSAGGNKHKHLKITGWNASKGDLSMTLQDIKEGNKYSVSIYEAYHKLVRVNPNEVAKYNVNVVSGMRYLEHKGEEYTVNIMKWVDYHSKRLNCKVWIRRLSDIPVRVYGEDRKPYYELYSVIGKGSFSLKHVHSYDSVAREQYTMKHNISVKEAKKIIFGDDYVIIPNLPEATIFKDFDKFFKQ